MSGGKLEDTNQKCAHVLIWSLFLLNADRRLEKGVEESVEYLHRLGSEQDKQGKRACNEQNVSAPSESEVGGREKSGTCLVG